MKSLSTYALPIVIVLGGAAIGLAVYVSHYSSSDSEDVDEATDWADSDYDYNQFNGYATEEEMLAAQQQQSVWEKQQALSDSLEGYALEVDFLPAPVSVEHPGNRDSYSTLYKVGTINNGALKGETLYVQGLSEMGGPYYTKAIIKEGLVVSLAPEKFSLANEINYPEEISIPGTLHKMKKGYSGSFLFWADTAVKSVFTTTDGLAFYKQEDGLECIVAEMPDHIGISYDLDIPFADEETGVLSIKLSNGSLFNSEEYSFLDFTCGGGCRLLKYVNEATLNPSERLMPFGSDPLTGETIYTIASSEDSVLKELYADENTVAYFREEDNWEHAPVSRYTYPEFIGHQPLLYWQDPWGKWVEFRNKRFEVAAEKCKPVIYLYPEEAAEYHVEVKPNGGFTKTIPEYKNGWDVLAMPDGTLTELLTGTEYPYLYWSGMGLNYPEIQDGWVVAQEDIETFLDEKLYTLGLDTKEIADFKEYWVPRLSEKPYYKITFMAPRIFSQMAPLTVAPQTPDTEIRVMMTAQGTDTKVELPELVLPPRPQRNGFVLVEWGGALLY